MPILFALFLGACMVLQAGVNRRLAGGWGLASVAVINSFVVLVFALLFFFAVRLWPAFWPEIYPSRSENAPWSWGFVATAFFGFLIVCGVPYAIRELGATQAVVAIVASQLFVSLIWDAALEGRPLTVPRVGGTLLALAGAWLVAR